MIAASKAEELKKIAAECEKLGGKAEVVAKRPTRPLDLGPVTTPANAAGSSARNSGHSVRTTTAAASLATR